MSSSIILAPVTRRLQRCARKAASAASTYPTLPIRHWTSILLRARSSFTRHRRSVWAYRRCRLMTRLRAKRRLQGRLEAYIRSPSCRGERSRISIASTTTGENYQRWRGSKPSRRCGCLRTMQRCVMSPTVPPFAFSTRVAICKRERASLIAYHRAPCGCATDGRI